MRVWWAHFSVRVVTSPKGESSLEKLAIAPLHLWLMMIIWPPIWVPFTDELIGACRNWVPAGRKAFACSVMWKVSDSNSLVSVSTNTSIWSAEKSQQISVSFCLCLFNPPLMFHVATWMSIREGLSGSIASGRMMDLMMRSLWACALCIPQISDVILAYFCKMG